MVLELMVCRECGARFGDDLFAEDPSETIVCPLCGTVALDAVPVEDRILHLHAFAAPALQDDVKLSA
jgi:transcription initiation factor TFIIIB Brf1 subunit/transcription initiation factor TFIIB